MKEIIFDVECDGINPTRLWCIVAMDVNTKQIYKFSDEDRLDGSIADGAEYLEKADILIAHNGIGFDCPVVDKLCGTNLLNKRIRDTWIMSQVLSFKRTFTTHHSLKDWGNYLGNYKQDFNEWDKYSTTMLEYCVQDVMVNLDIYKKLMEELEIIKQTNPLILKGLQIEQDTAKFNVKCNRVGWNFDKFKAYKNLNLLEKRMKEIENNMLPKLGTKTIEIDKELKIPKFKKDGNYNSHTVRWISELLNKEIDESDTHLLPPLTQFRRTKEVQIDIGQIAHVKEWLTNNGWKPDEWIMVKQGFEWVKKGPKITDTSLKAFGEDGEMIGEFFTLRNRKSVIEGWLPKLEGKRLKGKMWTVGTPTFRARHVIIANLPSVSSPWGLEIRELLKAEENHLVVGADSSGNQLRALCHYVGNDEFTQEVVHGDQHQRNAEILGCKRSTAKSYLYAYLFGAGDAKLGQVLTGKSNATVGKESRSKFGKGIKGLEELSGKLNKLWVASKGEDNGGNFEALDGRPVYVPSSHQCLNYLLQSAEAITCKAAVSYQMEKIAQEKLRATPRMFYHDESAWDCHPEDAKRVGEILQESFKEAPKWFGVECMDGGDYMTGESYADIH